jgi:hypothetical protein
MLSASFNGHKKMLFFLLRKDTENVSHNAIQRQKTPARQTPLGAVGLGKRRKITKTPE